MRAREQPTMVNFHNGISINLELIEESFCHVGILFQKRIIFVEYTKKGQEWFSRMWPLGGLATLVFESVRDPFTETTGNKNHLTPSGGLFILS